MTDTNDSDVRNAISDLGRSIDGLGKDVSHVQQTIDLKLDHAMQKHDDMAARFTRELEHQSKRISTLDQAVENALRGKADKDDIRRLENELEKKVSVSETAPLRTLFLEIVKYLVIAGLTVAGITGATQAMKRQEQPAPQAPYNAPVTPPAPKAL